MATYMQLYGGERVEGGRKCGELESESTAKYG